MLSVLAARGGPSLNTQDHSQLQGLTSTEAAARLKVEGYNELPAADRRGFLRIMLEVIRQPMFALLLVGDIVYLLLGDRTEAVVLLLFATLSVGITIVQESRSERVLETLRNLASPRALVIRDGVRTLISGREVVRDDLVVVTEGDRVAADAVLSASQDLLLDESLLTGESVPVRKLATMSKPAPNSTIPGGEDSPFIFAGTLVVRGTGQARVSATGLRSEMGKIGRALQSIEMEQPHLQKQMQWLVRDFVVFGGLAVGLVVLLNGLLRGSWLKAILGGIAIGMSLLPEEFPLITAVFMAMGAWRISRAKVLTRRASAIETLGSTTVLCTDKTGTLTENRMSVVAVFDDDVSWNVTDNAQPSAAVENILEAGLLACPRDASDPMDIAIHKRAAATHGVREPERVYGLRSDLLVVAYVYGLDDGYKAYAKGALEAVAEICNLSPERRAALRAQADALATDGIRVLAVAQTKMFEGPKEWPQSARSFAFEYVGLLGFADRLRPEVSAAVAQCLSAGIRVLMVTGDYPATARAIGRQAGIGTEVLTGDEINAMPDELLAIKLKTVTILARIRPEQKLRIVQCLKADGEVVAMTGDGVNDAPAIKAAHIGIAMGGRGTDVAREASAIVLLNDDFGSIVQTIRLGRRIYDNLRKAIEYTVAVHVPIAGLAIIPLLLGMPLILTPIHIAFLEMVIDPSCSIVLEAETEEDDVMRRPPRDPASPLLLPKRVLWGLVQGLAVLTVLAGTMLTAARMGVSELDLRALVFTSLILANVGLILVNRSFSSSIVGALVRPNPALRVLIAGVGIVLATALYFPPASALFHFGRLHWDDLGACLVVGAFSLIVLEVLKARWFRLDTPQAVQIGI
jgi:Ca2+-transporting ATPase